LGAPEEMLAKLSSGRSAAGASSGSSASRMTNSWPGQTVSGLSIEDGDSSVLHRGDASSGGVRHFHLALRQQCVCHHFSVPVLVGSDGRDPDAGAGASTS
jgi:hypothetical protein